MADNPVNEAVAVLVQQVRHLRELGRERLLSVDERDFLAMAARELREVEHGRSSLLVSLLAGKRPVEGLPAAIMERLADELEGARIPELAEIEGTDD